MTTKRPRADETDYVRRNLKRAIQAAQTELPPGYGVTLFAFPFDAGDDDTLVQYISNADRPSMINAVKAWIKRQEH